MIALLKSEFYKLLHHKLIYIVFVVFFVLGVVVNKTANTDYLAAQIDCMGFLFPFLPCVISGVIWTLEYSDGTLRYLLIFNNKKKSVFVAKTITNLVTITVMFVCYMVGVFSSAPDYFIHEERTVFYFGMTFLLLINNTMVQILFSVLFKSFSKLGLASIILMLGYIFCYKMSMIYHSSSIFLKVLAEHTFEGIYAQIGSLHSVAILFLRCGINSLVCLLCLVVAAVIFNFSNNLI